MTIAAGLVCDEGVIVCADSQETISGYIKQDQWKVQMYIYGAHCSIAVAGAGTAPYIDTALQNVLINDKLRDQSDLRKIELILEDGLLEFFDRHLSRWASFPQDDRPTVSTDKQQRQL